MKIPVKRILLVMSVVALMAAMLAVTAVPAFATIHELVPTEDVANDSASDIAKTAHPPGITPPSLDEDPPGPKLSATTAQPLRVVDANAIPQGECTPLGLCGTNEHKFGSGV